MNITYNIVPRMGLIHFLYKSLIAVCDTAMFLLGYCFRLCFISQVLHHITISLKYGFKTATSSFREKNSFSG